MAHVTVVASIEPEAFGRATIEAQAGACPVIATRLGAPPEAVVGDEAPDARTGWIVPPGDAQAMAAAIAKALALSGEDRQRMGELARANVSARFTLHAMCRDTLAVYDRLLATSLAEALERAVAPASS
jgi:glycosyltransferase involved in cell wall biosynthesis